MEFQIPKYSQGISKPGLRAKSFSRAGETRKYQLSLYQTGFQNYFPGHPQLPARN